MTSSGRRSLRCASHCLMSRAFSLRTSAPGIRGNTSSGAVRFYDEGDGLPTHHYFDVFEDYGVHATSTFDLDWIREDETFAAAGFHHVIRGAVDEAGTWGFDCRSTDAVGILTSYSTATTATMPTPASFTTGLPITTTRWLRWSVPMAGIQTTGCACFRVTVN